MRCMPLRLALVLVCAIAALAQAPTGSAVGAQSPPVPSLEPEATEALWARLTRRKLDFRPLAAQQTVVARRCPEVRPRRIGRPAGMTPTIT